MLLEEVNSEGNFLPQVKKIALKASLTLDQL